MGQSLIQTFPPSDAINNSPGVTPGFVFSKDGSCGVGTYLRIGSVITSDSGHPIIGKNKIVKIRITAATNVANATTVQIQQRTAVGTRSDIAGALIVIPAGTYKASTNLNVSLPVDVELCAYNKSGSTLSNAVMNVFLYPDYT